MKTSLLTNLNACLNNCATLSKTGGNDTEFVEKLTLQLTHYMRRLQKVYEDRPRTEEVSELIDFCEDMLKWIKTVPTEELRGRCTRLRKSITVSRMQLETAGRPPYEISKDSLEELVNDGFNWKQISVMFGVDRSTVTRRVAQYGIQKNRKPRISDADLTNRLQELHRTYPQAGYRMMAAFLQVEGVTVPLDRVNKALTKAYPEETDLRWKAMAKRRHYNVPRANSLWHIDSTISLHNNNKYNDIRDQKKTIKWHHKLIRWCFVVHAAVDGFSRTITFIKCSDNNRKQTVFLEFMNGVREFGLPSRVRGDYGGENKEVAVYMVFTRGENRGSFLAGKSTRNQRIERFWRDLFRLVCVPFYDHFKLLEKEGLLDIENNQCMAALHWVYLDRINAVIKHFKEGWNNHRMSSEKNWTPKQMWKNNLLQVESEDCTSDEASKFGKDWDGLNSNNAEQQVVVDSAKFALPYAVKVVLKNELGDVTLGGDSDNGTSLYLKAKDIINNMCN